MLWLDEFAKFDLGDAMAWTFAAKQRKMAMVGSDTDLVSGAMAAVFDKALLDDCIQDLQKPTRAHYVTFADLPAEAKQACIGAAVEHMGLTSINPPLNRIKPREAMTECVRPASLVKESAMFVVEPGASISYMNTRYHNGGDKPVTLRLDPNGHIELEQIDLGEQREIRQGTGQPLTATQVAEMQREMRVEAYAHEIKANSAMGYSYRESRFLASLKAKDEIIAGLRDELGRASSIIEANEAAEKRALFERDKAIDGLRDLCLERDKLKEDAELASIAISALIQANKELTAKLETAEEEGRNLHDNLMDVCEDLDRLNGEPKPNTRDTSRLGHFGEAQTRQGLALFDRYY